EEEAGEVEPVEMTLLDRLTAGLEGIKARHGWKNKDLAAKLDVTEGYMSQVMRGMRDVKVSMLQKMISELDVDVEELFPKQRRLRKASKPSSGTRKSKKKMTGES